MWTGKNDRLYSRPVVEYPQCIRVRVRAARRLHATSGSSVSAWHRNMMEGAEVRPDRWGQSQVWLHSCWSSTSEPPPPPRDKPAPESRSGPVHPSQTTTLASWSSAQMFSLRVHCSLTFWVTVHVCCRVKAATVSRVHTNESVPVNMST